EGRRPAGVAGTNRFAQPQPLGERSEGACPRRLCAAVDPPQTDIRTVAEDLAGQRLVAQHRNTSLPRSVGARRECVQCIDVVDSISYPDGPMELDQVETFVGILRPGAFPP